MKEVPFLKGKIHLHIDKKLYKLYVTGTVQKRGYVS